MPTPMRLKKQTAEQQMESYRRQSNQGFEIKEMDGKEFAKLGVLNYNDISKIFIDKKRAEQFQKEFTEFTQYEILKKFSSDIKYKD